jgi:hypothetical protein
MIKYYVDITSSSINVGSFEILKETDATYWVKKDKDIVGNIFYGATVRKSANVFDTIEDAYKFCEEKTYTLIQSKLDAIRRAEETLAKILEATSAK